MLRTLTDKLYSKHAAVKWLESNYPEDEIVFASAAGISEVKKGASTGWSFQRFFQKHRGVILITRSQIVLRSSIISLSFVFYMFLFILSVVLLIESRDWLYLPAVLVFGIVIAQFLPYQQHILLKDIRRTKLGLVHGIFTKSSLLTIYVKNKEINIAPAQFLSEDVFQVISPSKK